MTEPAPGVLQRILRWLRAGYPEGVPQEDYVVLLGVLHRSLTDFEVEKLARELRDGPAGIDGSITDEEIRAAIRKLARQTPADADVRRVAGRLADAFGYRAVLPIGSLIAIAGLALTLSGSLPVIVVGLALVVAGFFVVHGVASAWVPVRAYAAGIATAQAASLYLFSYYLGSSVFGTLAGTAYGAFGWLGVVGENAALFVGVGVLAYFLKHSEALPARG